jgi:hypothetical protein
MKKVQLNPVGSMSQLSQVEVAKLQDTTNSELFRMFRNCSLAVLNSGVDEDNYETLFAPYENYDIRLVRRERGVKIELVNPPEVAFVDDQLLKGVHEHLFAWAISTLFFIKTALKKVQTSPTWCLTCFVMLKR